MAARKGGDAGGDASKRSPYASLVVCLVGLDRGLDKVSPYSLRILRPCGAIAAISRKSPEDRHCLEEIMVGGVERVSVGATCDESLFPVQNKAAI